MGTQPNPRNPTQQSNPPQRSPAPRLKPIPAALLLVIALLASPGGTALAQGERPPAPACDAVWGERLQIYTGEVWNRPGKAEFFRQQPYSKPWVHFDASGTMWWVFDASTGAVLQSDQRGPGKLTPEMGWAACLFPSDRMEERWFVRAGLRSVPLACTVRYMEEELQVALNRDGIVLGLLDQNDRGCTSAKPTVKAKQVKHRR